ncbi:MAG TPA: hypothetical protein PKD98_05835 [Anaerolineae bacterium]|nr:hypothetical protein [Anaerolineae bacterium]
MLKLRTFVVSAFFIILSVGLAGRLQTEAEVKPVSPAPAALDWPVFSSEAGNFTVIFPDVPSEGVTLNAGDTPDEQIFTFRQAHGTSGFGLAYQTLADEVAPGQLPLQKALKLFDAACGSVSREVIHVLSLRCDRLVEQVEAQLATATLTKDDLPNWRAEFYIPASLDTPEGKGIIQIYVVNGNMYQLMAVGYPDDTFNQQAQAFFDSFAG